MTPINAATVWHGSPITVGTISYGVAFSPDGAKAYVANSSAERGDADHGRDGTPGTSITAGTQPIGVAFSPDGTKAYVTNGFSNNVTPITVANEHAGHGDHRRHGPARRGVQPGRHQGLRGEHRRDTR